EEWESLPYEQSDNDDTLTPFDVVKIKHENNVNLLGAWRIYRNLSQQEVADKVGISQGAISQMERSDSKPQKKTLERFSKIYDCDVKQMY
ncbi:helix-turn-helix transcriptional regulator, partial [Glaesserella parasuis]|uniref:helix-turn-helix domain-containing protein n=1 Tax=Glaesserella parasuis TaxID=738 RepID=UPI00243667E3